MEFKTIEVTTLEEVLKFARYNKTQAARIAGLSRTTFREHLKNPESVFLYKVDGVLKPFICDRRTGLHNRKETK